MWTREHSCAWHKNKPNVLMSTIRKYSLYKLMLVLQCISWSSADSSCWVFWLRFNATGAFNNASCNWHTFLRRTFFPTIQVKLKQLCWDLSLLSVAASVHHRGSTLPIVLGLKVTEIKTHTQKQQQYPLPLCGAGTSSAHISGPSRHPPPRCMSHNAPRQGNATADSLTGALSLKELVC